MKKIFVIFTFIIIGFSSDFCFAQTAEQNIAATAKKLAKEPLSKETLLMAENSMKWINQNHKFHLSCGISGNFLPISYKFRSNLFAAFIIGTVAFDVENPDSSKKFPKYEAEDNAKNAGLVNMVKSYEQIIKLKPEAKLERLDKLVIAYKKNSNLLSLFECIII